ncbi:MAG TPA: SWIM zinc finger family protein [Nitrosomonas mobilis]|nr:SWIM zinc finger family protein [Nitrosomonas mobilis]
MEEIIFKVKGSARDPYKVTFTKNKNNINAFCTCPAGENGQYCKHRFAIMAGDSKAVVSSNKEQIMVIKSWLPGSDLEEALMELAVAEHEHDKAKKRLSAAKKNIARAMRQ